MTVPSTGEPGASTRQPGAFDGEPSLRRVAQTTLPTDAGSFVVHAFVDPVERHRVPRPRDGRRVAWLRGRASFLRVHSECLTGDALGSNRCDCGDQLRAARHAIAEEGRGIIVYLRGHEGRGIGLSAKLQAYGLQDGGLDTVDANLALGLAADLRSYRPAAAVLKDLGVHAVRLLSSNPAKEAQLRQHGVDVVERIMLPVPARPENIRYLETKRSRMGHSAPLPAGQAWHELLAGRAPQGLRNAADAALVARYAPLLAAGPRLVLAQLGQSLDGFIAARTGDAAFVTGEEDRAHLHRLRALVDAVVVGVGTVVTDDCRLTVRAVEGRSPVRVLLDPTARAPHRATMLTDGAAPVLWCVGSDTAAPVPERAHVQVVPIPLVAGRFSPRDVLDALANRGLHRVLVEGGGRTVSQFLAAQVIDRIFLTTAPLLIGDGVPGLRFSGADRLSDAMRAPSRRFMLGEDVCVELDLREARRAKAARERFGDASSEAGEPSNGPAQVPPVRQVGRVPQVGEVPQADHVR